MQITRARLESRDGPSGASSGIDWQSGPGLFTAGRSILMYGPPGQASPVFQKRTRDALADKKSTSPAAHRICRTGDHRLRPYRPSSACVEERTEPDIVLRTALSAFDSRYVDAKTPHSVITGAS